MENAQLKHITVEPENNSLVVTCLDAKMESDLSSNEWNLEISELLDTMSERILVIDFRKVELVTSRVMGYLLSLKFLAEKKGIALGLCGFNGYISKAMSLMNLDSVFVIGKNRQSILDTLQKRVG